MPPAGHGLRLPSFRRRADRPQLKRDPLGCPNWYMRRFELLVIATLLLGCHPTTDVHGIYVGDDGEGTLFPCDDPTIIVRVPDSALAATYRLMVTELHQPVFVHLRGVSGHAGSIYGGPRYFLVHQVVEIRARQTGECPKVTRPVSPVLPSSSTGQPNKRLKLAARRGY